MKTGMDAFLEKRAEKYDAWLSEKKISYSSRVVPVSGSVAVKQWILPMEQVLAMLEAATSIALANCVCRSHYKRCDHPVEVCLLLDDYGDRIADKGLARRISYDEAAGVLKTADKGGLIHLSLYRPDHRLYALCSCCPCCCHDLQLLLSHNRKDLIAHSDYIVVTHADACIHCGTCVDRCVFGSRTRHGERVMYDPSACYGCGLCVTTCPVEALSMMPRDQAYENEDLAQASLNAGVRPSEKAA